MISLAKSLADRRFIPILQQTLNEICKTQNETSTGVEVVDAGAENTSRKRKRSSDVQFSPESLRSPHGCLKTAESLLGALKTLLQTLDPVEANVPSSSRMGAEHVKSLFCSPAKDVADLLRPILSICDIALQEQEPEPLENQDSWVATFSALWNFHLQGNGDASEVAMSLYPTGCIVMAKMDRSKALVLDSRVKARWARDLRRFFLKNMTLPARAAFLNRKDIGIFQVAVDFTNFMPTASCPVLFSLAARMPHTSDDAIARRDHQDWTQKVFDVVEEPIRNADAVRRNQAMKVVLDTAIDTKASISLGSLRTVCKQHTSTADKMDLGLVMRVATLDVDAFLISNEGHALLDDLFRQINNLSDADLAELEDANPVHLIQLLAKGYARGRDLVGFLKRWYESLAECFGKGKEFSSIQKVWSSQELIATVSSLLQSSVNTRQLLALLDWLESKRTTSKARALLVVLDAISQGISEEEYVDAINTRLYDIIAPLKLKSIDESSRARWWSIIENTVAWSPLDRTNIIWTAVASDLKRVLKKGDIQESATVAAFHCCNRFRLANFRRGENEPDAAALACSFSKRLQLSEELAAAEDLLKPLMHSESPRVVGFAAKAALTNSPGISDSAVHSVVQHDNITNNSQYGNGLIQRAIELLAQEQAKESAWDLDKLRVGVQTLLELPSEALSREQREQIAPKLLHLIAAVRQQKLPQPLLLVFKLLSLLIKIMSRPTFYKGMKFADLVAVGDAVVANLCEPVATSTNADPSSVYSVLYLYEDLASVTLKQMTTNWESREVGYFTEAVETISGRPAQTPDANIHWLLLLTPFARAIESAKVSAQCRQVVDPAKIRQSISSLLVSHLAAVDADKPTSIHLVALEHIDAADPTIIRDGLASREDLEPICNTLCEIGFRAGWRLKELMLLCFGEIIQDPLVIPAGKAIFASAVDAGIPLCARADTGDVRKYIDTVLKSMDGDKRDGYVLAMAQKIRDDPDVTGLLLTLHQLLGEESGKPDQTTRIATETDNDEAN